MCKVLILNGLNTYFSLWKESLFEENHPDLVSVGVASCMTIHYIVIQLEEVNGVASG
jgi:hypothetical protein